MKKTFAAVCSLFALAAQAHAVTLVEDFSTNPLTTTRWTFGIGDNSHSQFQWTNSAPAYTGDSGGSLGVHLNSSLPTARLQTPIGVMLSQNTDFTLRVRFSLLVTSAPTDQAIQIAFGLVNSALTGGDRTGSFANFGSDDVFHTVEFNYFANLSTFNEDAPGPTLAPVVFGAQKPGEDAFANSASLFGSDSDLGGNTAGITELPQNVTLQATLDYAASNKTVTLTMHRVNADGTLTLLITEVPAMQISPPPNGFSTYDSAFPFQVDTLAIMAYRDGFSSAADPSVIADMTFERFELNLPIVEPDLQCTRAGADVRVSWHAASGYQHQLKVSPDLQSWSDYEAPVTGTGADVFKLYPLAGHPNAFFRVVLTPLP